MDRSSAPAFGIKALVFLTPIALSILATHLVAKIVPRPPDLLPTILWWIALSVFATAVLFLADRLARKLLPLAALLQLSLVFPDRAPSRFKTAMRTQTVRQLKERIADIKASGLPDEPALAAEVLVELVADLSAHDRLTRGHAERVRAYSRMIGEELDLESSELDLLQWAGLAHDVGKLFVPAEILNKPGALTNEEFEVIKQHPGQGAELCEPLRGWLGDWVDAVGEHHERWDGRGYPSGLAGEEISLAARIVSVADVYDVITSVRSYKTGESAVAGRQELARCAGTQFDPQVVRAFLNISLGRLRLIMGPLSWLAQLPVVGRVPVGPAAGAAVSAAATAVTLVAGGLLDTQPAERPVVEAAPAVVVTSTTEVSTPPTTTDVPVVTRPTTPVTSPTTTTLPATTIVTTSEPPPTSPGPTTTRVVTAPATTLVVTAPTSTLVVTTLPITTTPPGTTSPSPGSSGPVAVDDVAAGSEGAAIVIDVAANDTGTVSAAIEALPANGTLTRLDETRFRFDPTPEWAGVTSFRYTAIDATGARASAAVTISIAATPDAPIARDDAVGVDEDGSVTVSVLANDSDADGDPLTVVSVTSDDGEATTDGTSVTFVPSADGFGTMTVRYTISDPTGRTSTATVTLNVVAQPDAPRAGSDAYSTQESTTLSVPAPGVLGNDSDEDGDSLTASMSTGPANGTVVLAGNGSFTYTPGASFVGTDTFSYVVSDGTGRSDVGTVTVDVGSSGVDQRFYLGTGGASASDWAMRTTALPNASPEIDHDSDGDPGLTIEKSGQKLTETDPLEFQHWSITTSSDLRLSGPVRLVLWSTAKDFDENQDIDYSVWLQDCAADGTGCVTLASSLDVHVDEWNGGNPTWVEREITIGSVDATVTAGRMLRLRVMFNHDDVWIALSGTRPSRLEYTRAL